MMKICFLTESLSPESGWGRYSLDLIKALSEKGVKCKVLTQKGVKNQPIDEVEILDIINSSPHGFLKSLVFDYLRIKKQVKDCHLIHSLIEPYAPLAYLLSSKKPFFITAHGTYAVTCFNKKKLRFLFQKVFKKAQVIFAVSNFTKKRILSKVSLDNIRVINNGIDYQKFQVSPDFKKSNGQAKIILSVGVLKARKGYHISIPAIAQVKKRFENLKYYIVGNQSDSNYFQKLKKLIRQLRLEDSVVFLKDLPDNDLIKLYYQSDLFLLTPININDNFEGFGLVYLEANACGIPVIGTKRCGAEDAIKDGYSGILVEQNNINQTAEALNVILSDDNFTNQLGRNGVVWAKRFDWQNICFKYQNIYDKFIK